MDRLLFTLAFTLIVSPVGIAQQAAPWQQEVHYEMEVSLLADRNLIEGAQRLTYTNNSPDTLRSVFYHLYFNAFHPQSLMAERNRHLPDPDQRVVPRIHQLGPDEVGFQRVRSLTQNGVPVSWSVYDTVMEVELAQPLLPGKSTIFEMEFEAQVPLQTRRSGRDNREGVRFSMTQWYPKIAAYDAIGWHSHPYIGREFYAPFGTFDVRLTLPSDYVVGATGTLQNPREVGHGYEQPPDGGRVATGPARRPDGTVPDSLTWHFRAERVHDFAWAADPEFIHERRIVTDVPGREEPVHIHLLYKPEVLQRWQQMGEWMVGMTRFFSERFGPYPYPQFTVAQGGDGGMEYPMMTLITGRRSPGSLFSVTAHEFAHMWFYGIVASNESLFSWIDEGFTNYATHEARHRVLAGEPGPANHSGAVQAVVAAQRAGFYERPNKQADWFETNSGFGVASYSAGQAFIALLGYVMGDEVRDRFLYRFATEWRWRHPYPADILQLAQQESGMQLYWLFDQFLNGAERYDYAATNLRAVRNDQGYLSTIALERRAPGVLPVDLWLRFADDSMQWVHIPADVAFGHKPVPPNWRVDEPWPWVQPTYQVSVEHSHPVVEAVIDPLFRTPDYNRANNRVARGLDIPLAFDGFFRLPRPYSNARSVTFSPFALYSHLYGVGAGAQIHALSPHGERALQLGVTLWPQAIVDTERGLPEATTLPLAEGAWHDGVDYTLRLRQVLGPHASLNLNSRKFVGIMETAVSGSLQLGGRDRATDSFGSVGVSFSHQHRTSDRAFQAPLSVLPTLETDFGSLFGQDHLLSARLEGEIQGQHLRLDAAAEVGGSLLQASGESRSSNRMWLTGESVLPIGPMALYARAATGLGADHLAPQKMFRLGAASLDTRWREAAFSVPAAFLATPGQDAHLFALSGIGPIAYLLSPEGTPSGNALAAGSIVLEAGPLRFEGAEPSMQALLDPLRFELFTGVGAAWRWSDGAAGDNWLADAGFGARYNLAEFAPLRDLIAQSDVLRGLNVTARFPVWTSDPDRAGSANSFEFRWIVGIETGI